MEEEGNAGGGMGQKSHVVESPYRQRKSSYRTKFKLLLLLGMISLLIYSARYKSMAWWESFPLHVQYHRLPNRTNWENPNGIYHAETHVVTEVPMPTYHAETHVVTEAPMPTYHAETHVVTEAPMPTYHAETHVVTEAPMPTYHAETHVVTEAPMTSTDTDRTTVPPFRHHLAYAPNYHFIMDNTTACKAETPFLVLMVPVAPAEVAARDAIRKTWGNESRVHGALVKTLFMLGLPGGAGAEQQQEKLRQENLLYGDLIQSDFMDTYVNLTIKTMVIMDWLATRCSKAQYAMKIDSDMFLNIDNLVSMLQLPGIPKQNYLTGMLMWNRPVLRSKDSKWYVPKEMYPEDTYPTYTLGMGYVFSNDLPGKYVEISKEIKPFNIEDAYIGMCMKKMGLSPTSPPNPSQFKAYNTAYNRCEYSQIITYILSSPEQLLNYWTDLKKPGPPC